MKRKRIGTCILVGVLATSIIAFSGCSSSQGSKSGSSSKSESKSVSSIAETTENKINQSEAVVKAEEYLSWHDWDIKNSVETYGQTKEFTISNIQVATNDVTENSYDEKYTVTLKGTFSRYDEYGQFDARYTFDAYYYVTYDGIVTFGRCYSKRQ